MREKILAVMIREQGRLGSREIPMTLICNLVRNEHSIPLFECQEELEKMLEEKVLQRGTHDFVSIERETVRDKEATVPSDTSSGSTSE